MKYVATFKLPGNKTHILERGVHSKTYTHAWLVFYEQGSKVTIVKSGFAAREMLAHRTGGKHHSTYVNNNKLPGIYRFVVVPVELKGKDNKRSRAMSKSIRHTAKEPEIKTLHDLVPSNNAIPKSITGTSLSDSDKAWR